MRMRPLLLVGATVVYVWASGNHGYDFTNENFISKSEGYFNVVSPPNGLDSSKVPQFITLGFDDNKFADGVDWVRDTLLKGRVNHSGNGNKATYDGTPIAVDFNVIGNSDYAWSENPFEAPLPSSRPVTESWRRAYDGGLGVNNHTWTHNYNLYDLDSTEWKNSGELPPMKLELGFCQKYLVNIMGMPVEHIFGFRTPYLASSITDNTSFRLTKNLGVLYDCTLGNGMQGNNPAEWAYNGWPGMMNSGWGPYDAVAVKGLWQIPNATFQVSEGGQFSDKGFDSGKNGWPGGASAEEMFKQMKSAIDWSYNKNRAPIDLGLHSDYYSNKAQNTSGTAASKFTTKLAERQKALVMLLDYIENELPDARVVKKVDIIRWMRNPVLLEDKSRNVELTFSESDTKTTLSSGAKSFASAGSSAEISGNEATVTVKDEADNWMPDSYAGMKWDLNGSLDGSHSIRVTYKSDLPLRLMFIQDNMSEAERGYYGIGLPTTLGENKTVELPFVTDYVEPPRPYVASQTLDLSKVTSVALVGQVFDTTMSGTFSADIDIYGGAVSVAKPSANTHKKGIALERITGKSAQLTVPSAGGYQVEVFTYSGRKLVSQNLNLNAGANQLKWDNALAAGFYLTKISGNGTSVTMQHIVRQ